MTRLPTLAELRSLLSPDDRLASLLEDSVERIVLCWGQSLFQEGEMEPDWLSEWTDRDLAAVADILAEEPYFPEGWPGAVSLVGAKLLDRWFLPLYGRSVGYWIRLNVRGVSTTERLRLGPVCLLEWLERRDALPPGNALRVMRAYAAQQYWRDGRWLREES